MADRKKPWRSPRHQGFEGTGTEVQFQLVRAANKYGAQGVHHGSSAVYYSPEKATTTVARWSFRRGAHSSSKA